MYKFLMLPVWKFKMEKLCQCRNNYRQGGCFDGGKILKKKKQFWIHRVQN